MLSFLTVGETLAEVAITVPCYNEADRLKCDAFIDFVREHRDVMFIFVDDGSTDNTAQLLKSMSQSEANNIRFMTLETNRGKAEAVRQGTLSAIAAGAKYVGYWDADLATPLNPILEFVAELKKKSRFTACDGRPSSVIGTNHSSQTLPPLLRASICDRCIGRFTNAGVRHAMRSKNVRRQ